MPHAILIIDDSEPDRELVKALLAPDGYELRLAASAEEGFAELARALPSAVICDALMPGMDGFDVCRRIKAHPDWRYVPVLLVTSLDQRDDQIRGLDAGADDFLSKPLDQTLLRARTRVILRIREHYESLGGGTGAILDRVQAHVDRVAATAHLSPREREVLGLMLLGRTNDQIGDAISISRRTAKFHVANVLAKLGAESRTDLLRVILSL